jgi:hypothetical protein
MKLLLLGLALFTFSADALAYIDPNTGGLLFQLLAPLFIVLAAAWAFLRRGASHLVERVIAAFKSLFKRDK